MNETLDRVDGCEGWHTVYVASRRRAILRLQVIRPLAQPAASAMIRGRIQGYREEELHGFCCPVCGAVVGRTRLTPRKMPRRAPVIP